MPRFQPFPGVRYDVNKVRLDDVIAPPYDVVDAAGRDGLAARDRHNAIVVELPADDASRGLGRYEAAARTFDKWIAAGVLTVDATPSFYVYRMRFVDEEGNPRHTLGVVGALEVEEPGSGDVLPHEETMPKPKGDRIDLLRATRMNTSPVWGLSLARGLSALIEPSSPPAAHAVDDDGVGHELWRIDDPATVAAVAETVAAAPVVLADGHHRYETAFAYRNERRAANGSKAGDFDQVMAFVVEIAEDQLSVRAIHRLLRGLPDGFDLPGALGELFEVVAGEVPPGALGLFTKDGSWRLTARPVLIDKARDPELDSSLVATALAALPDHSVEYRAGRSDVLCAVETNEAQAAIVLRPVTVAKIAAMARERRRMPPKTTYFHPKPRTGMVFRPVPG